MVDTNLTITGASNAGKGDAVKRTRKLLAAGLTAFAMLSTTMAASAAASAEFEALSYPATLSASGNTQYMWLGIPSALGEEPLACSNPALSNGQISEASEAVTLTPANTSCSFYWQTPLEMNGCKFKFDANGVFTIGPAGCGPIVLNTSECRVEIGAQSSFGLSYENIEPKSESQVAATLAAEGLAYSVTEGSVCKKGTYSDGSLSTSWSLKASSGGLSTVGTPEPPAEVGGVYLSSFGFASEFFPVSIEGSEPDDEVFAMGEGLVASCGLSSSVATLASSSKSLSVSAEYSDCEVAGLPAEINANSCVYDYTIEDINSLTGGVSVSCAKEGDAIEIPIFLDSEHQEEICTVSFPDQSGGSGVDFATVGTGNGRGVAIDNDVDGTEMVASGALCPWEGVSNEGSFRSHTELNIPQ